MRKSRISRRGFLAASLAPMFARTAAGSTLSRVSANDRIQVGIIGLGSRGFNLLDAFAREPQARITAICDVDRFHYRDRQWGQGLAHGREPGRERLAKAYANKKSGTPASDIHVYSDYRELVDRADLDAVVVATPDHWHALCTLRALKNGKDVYCEKPVTHLFAEGQQVYHEVARCEAVFQTGSQQRSDWEFRRAVELAWNGWLGTLQRIEVGLPPGYEQAMGDPALVDPPAGLDYEMWCGPAPKLPYSRAWHHRWWRGHRAFGGGVLMDWIGHHNDIAHWALELDKSGPLSVEAVGWTYPKQTYNTPHQYEIRSEYHGGVTGSISSQNKLGTRLIGDEGWVYVTRGKIEASEPAWVGREFKVGDRQLPPARSHVQDFLNCVRTRSTCVAPAETAHRSITPGHLAYVSDALKRKLKWDADREAVIGDDEANRLLHSVEYRRPWQASL